MSGSIWSVGTKDFFTKKMLSYAIVPLLGTMTIMYILFFIIMGVTLDSFKESSLQISSTTQSVENGVASSDESNIFIEGGSAVADFIFTHTITSWLAGFVVMIVGGYVIFILSMVVTLIIIGFMTPYIVKEIKRRHYVELADERVEHSSSIIWTFIKHFSVAILLFILLIPFYFIPFINVIAFHLPFYYLFHNIYLQDVAEQSVDKEIFKKILYYKKNSLRLITLTLFAISLIPFLALFTPVYIVIILTHKILQERLALSNLN